jgi:KaiC/GvpD/RAD55 family RecA-like ATPase
MKNESNKPTDNHESDKTVYTLEEITQLTGKEPDYLLSPIIPRIGTSVLAAKPDVGKSQLARQLCLAIISEQPEFLGLKLNTIQKRAIYVATEDHAEAISFLVKKQMLKFGVIEENRLIFICADTLTPKEIHEKILIELKKTKADLVVVDSFGDIFSGNDLNNNAMVRRVTRIFDSIAKRYKCALMFIHHINKAAYHKSPSQQYIQGGSGLVQRIRTALFLSEGKGSIKYLSIAKGNYVSKLIKSRAIELEFSEETFTFSPTGNTIPVEEVAQNGNQAKELNPEKFSELAEEIFEGKTLRHNEFIEKYKMNTGESTSSAKRFLNKVLDLGITVKTGNGDYLLHSADSSPGNMYSIDFETLDTQQSRTIE